MERTTESSSEGTTEASTIEDTCDRCGRILSSGWSFQFKIKTDLKESAGQGLRTELTKCLRCSLMHWPMLKKSLAACVVVGTLLTALNQGDILLAGSWNSTLWWKIPLTYAVPFLVATYGAMSNNRR